MMVLSFKKSFDRQTEESAMKDLNEITKTMAALPPDIVSLVYVVSGFALAGFTIYAMLVVMREKR
jgi:hypothetical protein